MSRPAAAILLTGNELLRGVIADENGAHLAASLERLGFSVRRTLVVGDRLEDIIRGLRELIAEADLVVSSGGLGPTHDDRTVEALAEVAGAPLELDPDVLARIDRWTDEVAVRYNLDRAGFNAGNRKQAHVPAGAEVLGMAGTAPGLIMPVGSTTVVVLPGVPSELRRLWADAPGHAALSGVFASARPRARWLTRTYGIGESHVADIHRQVGGDPPGVETSICARSFEIEIDVRADPGHEAAGEELARSMRAELDHHVFATDERPLAEIVLDLLRERSFTGATAESCTGGMVAAMLTDIAGSSEAFAGGVVAYSDALKRSLLDVPADLLKQHGAVSAETAAAMAQGARTRLGADAAVAITGVAGPGGGSPEKPVGLVYLHVSSPAGDDARRMDIPGTRAAVRGRAATAALQLLRGHLVTHS
ncbi:MAG TPA: CinA family nicotinamide mononucleotide deamidase-related protein [Gaiellales bacterium]|nr:CinA family nicotinamide mononucleotide deamidase-related protein [Gaiellales bacterium]